MTRLASFRVNGLDLEGRAGNRTRGQKAIFSGYEATYRSPEGRQSTANDMYGNTDAGPNSTVYEEVIFPRAKPGGVMTVAVSDPNYNSVVNVKIKTR
jgi:hypothetical protein